MIRDAFSFKGATTLKYDLALVDQLLQEGCVVDNLVLATQLRIFVLQGIEAVRTCCYDLLDVVPIQQLNVLIRHHLEKELISGAANRVAGAHLFFTQNGKGNVEFLQDTCEGTGDALCPLIEAACTPHPEQDLRLFAFCCPVGHGFERLHRHAYFLCNTKIEQKHRRRFAPCIFAFMPNTKPSWLNWERWPFKLIYFPLTPVWLWYCSRSRSLWFFSSSNPTITFGGMEGEGKQEMYEQLPSDLYPKTIFVKPGLSESALLFQLRDNGFQFPFVVKPDVGMKGLWFERIESADELLRYHRHVPADYVIQEWNDWPVEVSIFYYRHPASDTGVISGFIHKTLLQVQGDGRSTLLELIQRHPKAADRVGELSLRHAARFDTVIPDGEIFLLSHAANHNRGAFFYNLSDRIHQGMVDRFDRLSRQTQFFYGRYDLKVRSIDDFCSGGSFSILEFNGCGAEPNHIYDCGMSLWQAYRVILTHWRALFRISRYNHRAGHRHWGFVKGLRFLHTAGKHFKKLEKTPRTGL